MIFSKFLEWITGTLLNKEELPLDQSFTFDICGMKTPTEFEDLKMLDYYKNALGKKNLLL